MTVPVDLFFWFLKMSFKVHKEIANVIFLTSNKLLISYGVRPSFGAQDEHLRLYFDFFLEEKNPQKS